MEKSVEFKEHNLVNEYGSAYGVQYIVTGPQKADFNDLYQKVIKIIGEEYFYGPRDVWDQIEISDGREI